MSTAPPQISKREWVLVRDLVHGESVALCNISNYHGAPPTQLLKSIERQGVPAGAADYYIATKRQVKGRFGKGFADDVFSNPDKHYTASYNHKSAEFVIVRGGEAIQALVNAFNITSLEGFSPKSRLSRTG